MAQPLLVGLLLRLTLCNWLHLTGPTEKVRTIFLPEVGDSYRAWNTMFIFSTIFNTGWWTKSTKVYDSNWTHSWNYDRYKIGNKFWKQISVTNMCSNSLMHIPGLWNLHHEPKVACKQNLPGAQEHFNVPPYFCKKWRKHCKPRAAKKYVYLLFTGAV